MSAAFKQAAIFRLPLDAITLDTDLQPRARIDHDLLEEYADAIVAGARFPPVVVFQDDNETRWLADGYHRWHAHKAIGWPDVAVETLAGGYDDALRYSLSANATHGKRRNDTDYKRAYDVAVAHHLADATSAESVADCLKCSLRTARDLTETARDEARRARDAEIAALAAEGKSERQIVAETGLPKTTVHRSIAGGPFRQTAVSDHPGPVISDRVRAWFSPEAQRWSELLRALEVINALPEPDIMLETPDHDLDHALLPALRDARLRLVTLWEILDV